MVKMYKFEHALPKKLDLETDQLTLELRRHVNRQLQNTVHNSELLRNKFTDSILNDRPALEAIERV